MADANAEELVSSLETVSAERAATLIQRSNRHWRNKNFNKASRGFHTDKRLELFHLCQQAHLYNQEFYFHLLETEVVLPEPIQTLSREEFHWQKSKVIPHTHFDTNHMVNLPLPINEFISPSNDQLRDESDFDTQDNKTRVRIQVDLQEVPVDVTQFSNASLRPVHCDVTLNTNASPSLSSSRVMDPIAEMARRGFKLKDNTKQLDVDDDAPFNFQAMLRKTKFAANRNSLKRRRDFVEIRKDSDVEFDIGNCSYSQNAGECLSSFSNDSQRDETRQIDCEVKDKVEQKYELIPGLEVFGFADDL